MTDTATLERDDAAWDAFVATSSSPSHLQTSSWAAIKRPNGWRSFRIVAGDGERTLGAQVLVQRPRGVPWGMGYIGRGPVGARPLDARGVEAFTSAARGSARRHRLAYLRMEPEAEAGTGVEATLEAAGWRPAPHVQPESTLLIDLARDEAAILADMHRKCRQSIAKSERLGVIVVESDGDRIGDFHAIHTQAMRHAGIAPRDIRTYRDMWQQLAPRGMARLFFAQLEPSGGAVATLFLVSCGPRAVDLYGGTTAEGGRTRANYLLKWEAIRRSREAGLREYDLWGLPREGIAQFKSGFGGREVRYVGAWDLVTDRVGHAVLRAGESARSRYRRWRYRDVHRPDDADGDGGGLVDDAG